VPLQLHVTDACFLITYIDSRSLSNPSTRGPQMKDIPSMAHCKAPSSLCFRQDDTVLEH
jgi:hypothetical protein